MQIIRTEDLKPGMVTADYVISRRGQVIVDKNITLTRQMIAHMEFYGIPSAVIEDGEIPEKAKTIDNQQKKATESYYQKIRDSREYKEFKQSYEKKVDFLNHSLNDAITKNIPIDQTALLDQIMELFTKHATTISMFDMLHNMRSIDDSTYAHSINVALIARMIGMWLNYSEDELDILTMGGLLHDVGKSLIPDSIISKPAKLTEEEYAEMKKHSKFGYEILRKMPIDPAIKKITLNHHERCDGSGYPIGLVGDDIDDYSIIISIADVYDAMTADRCYRHGMCPFEVIATFEYEGLNKYKPRFIMTFLENIANTYLNNHVMLSNGLTGKIVMINKGHLTRPVVQLDTGKFINLEKMPDLYVQAII